ncbi:hypothetical protein JCM9279_001474 [Rhodotorula babjevae]
MSQQASTIPLSISASLAAGSPSAPPLPAPIHRLVLLRAQADAALNSPALRAELATGHAGPNSLQARDALDAVVNAAAPLLQGQGQPQPQHQHQQRQLKLSAEDEARAEYCLAFALARVGEFDGTPPSTLPHRLDDALSHFGRAADLLRLPPPPALDSVPSVTRPQDPNRQHAAVDLSPVPAWAAEMLAEWARAQTTRAFTSCVGDQGQTVVHEDELADLLDLACRRNVQALFTPIDPLSPEGEHASSSTASTVLGSARLVSDLSSLLPFAPGSPSTWARRLNWATHVADVRFVSASMSANALVDAASAHAQVLQARDIDARQRREVKRVVERTLRRIAPYERTQGNVLLGLGRVLLDAVGALYLGRQVGFQEERRMRETSEGAGEEDEDEGVKVLVPENDLVRETRQVLIRAAALFENAYASILRSPPSSSRRNLELRLLRRLEATYCDLELLDNDSTPEVVELKSQRIERAVLINDALVALGDGQAQDGAEAGRRAQRNGAEDEGPPGEDDMEGSDQERAEEERAELESSDDDDEDEEDRLARRFARAARLG